MRFEGLHDRSAKLAGKRVLVVEDETLIAMLVEDALCDAGATVLGPSSSVGEALRLVESAMADGGITAAVLDINLQGEAVAPVADMLAARGVPFVFSTGYGEGHGTRGYDAVPTLHKPYDLACLVATVQAIAAARLDVAAMTAGNGPEAVNRI